MLLLGAPLASAQPAFTTRTALKAAVDACIDFDAKGTSTGAECQGGMSTWDVSAVTDMNHLFSTPTSNGNDFLAFHADVSAWDVRSGMNFSGTFRGAKAFDADVTLWAVDAAADTSLMFEGADAWLAIYANCGHDATATSETTCGDRGRFETRDASLVHPPASSGAYDGPPAAWRLRRPCAELDKRGFTRSARVASFICADEGQSCACPGGRVTYGQKFAGEDRPGSGAGASFAETRSRRHRVVDVAVDANPVECSDGTFGDPRPGYHKRCWCSPSERTCDALAGDASSTPAGGCGRLRKTKCADLINPGVVTTACDAIQTTDPVFGAAFTVTCTPGGYFRANPDQDTGTVYVRVEAPFAFDELTWSGALYSSGGTGGVLVDGPEENKRTVLIPTTNGGGGCFPNCMSTQGGVTNSDPTFEAVDKRVLFEDAATRVEWLAWSDYGNIHGGSGAYVQIDRLRVCMRTRN